MLISFPYSSTPRTSIQHTVCVVIGGKIRIKLSSCTKPLLYKSINETAPYNKTKSPNLWSIKSMQCSKYCTSELHNKIHMLILPSAPLVVFQDPWRKAQFPTAWTHEAFSLLCFICSCFLVEMDFSIFYL